MKLKDLRNILVIMLLLIALPMSIAVVDENDDGDIVADEEDENGDDNGNGDTGDDENEENGDENGNGDTGDDENEENGDENGNGETVSDDRETSSFKTNHGSYVRLLQLERSIHRNILFGNALLERVNIQDGPALEKLKEIIEALENLKTEVSVYGLKGQEEDVRKFVELKHDAINLTKQFRDTIRTFVQESEQNALRAQINREIRETGELNRYNNAINARARQHNEEVVVTTAEEIGMSAQEIIERFRNEELDHREIKTEMLNLAKQARAQGDKDFVAELREAALREKIRARNEVATLRDELKDEHMDRIKNRIEEVRENLGDEIAQRVNARLNPGNGRNNGNANGIN